MVNFAPLLASIKTYSEKIIGSFFIILFTAGLFFPESNWGFHALAFIPKPIALILLLVCAILVFSPKIKLDFLVSGQNSLKVIQALILVVAGIVFYKFNIPDDFYGNARGFQKYLPKTVESLPEGYWSDLLSFKSEPGNGRRGVLHLVTLTSFLTGGTYLDSFRLICSLTGTAFLLVWFWILSFTLTNKNWKLMLTIVASFSPFLLVYFGHLESYSVTFLFTLIWGGVLIKYCQSRKIVLLIVLTGLTIICVRFSNLSYLIIPSLLVAYWGHLTKKQTVNFKKVFSIVVLTLLAAGALGYFFVFKDYNDPRALNNFEDIDRLFLPIVSPESPLDKYNLLSANHIYDYFNSVVGASAVLVGIMLIILFSGYKSRPKQLEFLCIVIAFVLFSIMLFMINPLFSMPMDWDLFCFPAIFLLLILVLLIREIEDSKISLPTNSVISLVLLCIPSFYMYLSEKTQPVRMVEIGTHVYKTYYEHASTYLLFSLQKEKSPESYLMAKGKIYDRLEGRVQHGVDKQYADLLIDDAIMYERLGQREKSTEFFSKAQEVFPFHPLVVGQNENFIESLPDSTLGINLIKQGANALRSLNNPNDALSFFNLSYEHIDYSPNRLMLEMESYFVLEDFEKAYIKSTELVIAEYPSRDKSLRIAVHVSLEAEKYAEAKRYAGLLLETDPSDQLMSTVVQRIEDSTNLEDIRLLFSSR